MAEENIKIDLSGEISVPADANKRGFQKYVNDFEL